MLAAAPATRPTRCSQRCHGALTRSRGAVMTLAWFDLEPRRLRWTGVGNVEGRLVRAAADPRRPSEGAFMRGGVVGYNLPAIRVTTTELHDGDLLVLATDGVSSGFAAALDHEAGAQELAERVLEAHGKATDDALVVVVRCRLAGRRPRGAPSRARRARAGVAGAGRACADGELDVADAARAARDRPRPAADRRGGPALATAVSEVAMNAWKYAGGGEVELVAAVGATGGRGCASPCAIAGPASPTWRRPCATGRRRAGRSASGCPARAG